MLVSPCTLLGADNDNPAQDVLVKGTGFAITREELDAEMARMETQATNRGEAIVEERWNQLRAELLDRLIFRRLMMTQATDVDKRRAKFEADAFVAGAKAEAPSTEAYLRRLKRAGFTEESLAADKFAEVLTATVVDRVIRAGIRVDEGRIGAIYDSDPGRWTTPATTRGLDLMMSSKDVATGAELEGAAREQKLKQLRAVRARAAAGEDFAKLVKQFSEDAQGRELGGIFTLAQTGAAPELEGALSTLKAGEISDVLTTPSGLHIVKVLETSPAKKTSLAEAGPKIRAELVDAEFKRQLPPFVARLRKDANLSFAPGAPRSP
jgi:parvulin-like peptidyl-prolyl isomerase